MRRMVRKKERISGDGEDEDGEGEREGGLLLAQGPSGIGEALVQSGAVAEDPPHLLPTLVREENKASKGERQV